MSEKDTISPQTQPNRLFEENIEQNLNIGIAANYDDNDETRILLTPEACGIIVSAGHTVTIQSGLGIDIDFSDDDYARYGAKVASREEVLSLPIVFSYTPLKAEDVHKMVKGSTLMCMLDNSLFDPKVVEAYLQQHITLCCLNNMLSINDEPVFANIIDEIDGRAAIMYAEEHLSFLGGGKGVLLAGVAGINPCEVLLIGAGTKIHHAAMAAIAAGATATVMDNDVSSLQIARQICGDHIVTCAIHPKVLINRVKSADVIILDNCTRDFEMPRTLKGAMKENVYILDLTKDEPSQSVPRTVAMAMSNIIVNLCEEISIKNGIEGIIMSTPGVQESVVTYRGNLVDKLIGSYLGMHGMDLSMLIAGGN